MYNKAEPPPPRKKESVKTERCVLCGANTGITVDTPINLRNNYIYGSGQLCGECYRAIKTNKFEK